ncbi:MAG: YceI family protein [Gemmatimonadaceae bacterium]
MTSPHLDLDAGNTRVTFDVRWFGFFPVRGWFRRLHGALEFGEAGISFPRLRVDVDAASVATGLALRDRHLRAPRFLHSDLHPYISFQSRGVRREGGLFVVDGTLSLRGIEAPVRSTCPIDEIGDGQRSLELCGNIVVSRRQFGIGVPRGLGALNPLFPAISDDVHVNVRLTVPAARLLPVLRATVNS